MEGPQGRYRSYSLDPPKFIAGAPGLDLLNTVEWRGDPQLRADRLSSFEELAIWCTRAGLIEAEGEEELFRAARRHPDQARHVLSQVIDLRETLAFLLEHPGGPQPRHVEALNRKLSNARCRPCLVLEPDGRLRSDIVPDGAPLERLFATIALEVASLLAPDRAGRVCVCANPRCGWFFLDTSRNHSRRWCDMATCGNQAKARAHRARRTQGRGNGKQVSAERGPL